MPDGPGSYYPATVLLDCTADMSVMAEETFGPVAPVQVVDSFEDGLRLAAGGRYGLAATVLTGRIAHAQQAIAALPVGTVKINEVFGGAPGGSAQPRGDSGSGFGYGPELLDEFTRVKVVHLAPPPGEPAAVSACHPEPARQPPRPVDRAARPGRLASRAARRVGPAITVDRRRDAGRLVDRHHRSVVPRSASPGGGHPHRAVSPRAAPRTRP